MAGKIQQFKPFSPSHMTVIVNRKYKAAELWRWMMRGVKLSKHNSGNREMTLNMGGKFIV